jgi:hypothetical protein
MLMAHFPLIKKQSKAHTLFRHSAQSSLYVVCRDIGFHRGCILVITKHGDGRLAIGGAAGAAVVY